MEVSARTERGSDRDAPPPRGFASGKRDDETDSTRDERQGRYYGGEGAKDREERKEGQPRQYHLDPQGHGREPADRFSRDLTPSPRTEVPEGTGKSSEDLSHPQSCVINEGSRSSASRGLRTDRRRSRVQVSTA